MEDGSMVAHDEVNGQWELRGSMKCDELGDMGHLVPMRLKVHYEHRPHFQKTTYCYNVILNLQT